MTREDEATNPEPLGKEGDVCAQCGTKLAVDQRYCLNCGTPRAEPRLDFQRHLSAGGGSGAGPSRAGAGGGGVQWSPLFVVLAIAALGVMLLLGVLIGKDDNEVTVTEVPASTTTTTTPAATTPTTTPTTPTTTTPSGTEGATPVPEGSGEGGAQRQDGAGSGGLAPGGTD